MTKRGFLKSLTAGTLAGIPAVKAVEVLEVRPDQILILKLDGYASQETMQRMKEIIRENIPGQKCMVLGEGMDLMTLKVNA